MEDIEWDEEAADHIRSRSGRYPGAVDIELVWTSEAINDPDRLVDEPDPHSAHANSVRIVGYSTTARMVITIVALRDHRGVLHGASAWKTRGAPLRQYLEGRPMTEPTHEDLRDYRLQAEHTPDVPLSPRASRPGQQRAKVLSVRLNAEEFDELTRFAEALKVPASALVRGWVLDQLHVGAESPIKTVERIAHELEQLRRQLAA